MPQMSHSKARVQPPCRILPWQRAELLATRPVGNSDALAKSDHRMKMLSLVGLSALLPFGLRASPPPRIARSDRHGWPSCSGFSLHSDGSDIDAEWAFKHLCPVFTFHADSATVKDENVNLDTAAGHRPMAICGRMKLWMPLLRAGKNMVNFKVCVVIFVISVLRHEESHEMEAVHLSLQNQHSLQARTSAIAADPLWNVSSNKTFSIFGC
jgi:hypothetical protein